MIFLGVFQFHLPFQILTDIAAWTRMQERECKTSIRNSKNGFEEDCFSSSNSELYIGFV